MASLFTITKFEPFHSKIFVVSTLTWGLGGSAWFTALQFLIPAVKGKWGWSEHLQGIYPSAFYVGMAIGAAALGRVSDLHGRRSALLIGLVLSSFFGICVAFAPNGYVLVVTLALQGVGVGGLLPIANMLFGEW
jgi:AAHS family 4-hydroxybenzoate transporter-like MFS transporter